MGLVQNLREDQLEGYRIKTTFVAINTQYVHTNPAVRGIAACCERAGFDVSIVESTINNSPRSILEEICSHKSDIYIFSCYLWNVDMVERVSSDLRSALPKAIIGVGGPQVSFSPEQFLAKNPQIDLILSGEGEESVSEMLSCFEQSQKLDTVKGLCFRAGTEIVNTGPSDPVDMDSLPFAYSDLDKVKDRILYYESMRGCPFQCSYCLSGKGEKIRVRDLNLVFRDLDIFLKAGVKQVKFVDRTFNALKTHALSIWKYLIEKDNGTTNFHFEMSGELLDAEMITLLKTARPGLFQFEIGVQSVNDQTLEAIRRPSDFAKLSQTVETLREMGNIHLHLDLIAGLPYEDYESFKGSFDKVYELKPHQFQLGFLKVLSGSEMERMADTFGIEYSKYAPFEVISTKWLKYEELCELFGVADMLDIYYNSGSFAMTLEYLQDQFESPFSLYHALWEFYKVNGYDKAQLSSFRRYEALGAFMEENEIILTDKVKWLIKLDMLKKEKFARFPSFVDVDMSEEYKAQIRKILSERISSGQSKKMSHLEIVPFHPKTGAESVTAVLFDYANKDISYISLAPVI